MNSYNQNVHSHHQPYDERKRLEIEAEMNRFENEVLSVTNTISGQHSVNTGVMHHSMPVHFIPHQIQRQLPQPATSQQRAPVQGTFVPATGSQVSASGHSSSNPLLTVNKLNVNTVSGQHVNYTVTPMQTPSVVHSIPGMPNQANTGKSKSKNTDKGKKQKKTLRIAGGVVWEDPTLNEWDSDDFRIFCGDLGNDVTDEVLARAFNRFPTFIKAKVVRDKRSNKSRGYGFVSFKDPQDFARAIKEMNGKYVGSRPIKLRKSNWRDRNLDVVKRKHKASMQMHSDIPRQRSTTKS